MSFKPPICLLSQPEEDTTEEAAPIRVCVIDLGTNSFHTVIVEAYSNGTYKVVDRLKEIVHLGENGFRIHKLSEAAMARGLLALQRIRLLADGLNVTDYLAFATSAIREAANGGDFIERVKLETDIHIRPISGQKEAELIYLGIRHALALTAPSLLVDIGGGSTEFIVGDDQQSYFIKSLKVGAARMTEQFITTDPLSKKEFNALGTHYQQVLMPIFQAVRQHKVRTLVGSSGSMENLAQVYVGLEGDASRSIFQQPISADALRGITQRIIQSTSEERANLSGIDEKRRDQIVAGAALVDVLLQENSIEEVVLSPHALREGMVLHFIEKNYERLHHLPRFSNVRRRSVYEQAYRFDADEQHALHITTMALYLFDQTGATHGLGAWERELLEDAGLLHDIGYHISHRSHHKHSMYLIQHADLLGFQPEEVQLIANVARYHRRSHPKKSHPDFMSLSKPHRHLVMQLAAFLRLAEGLDRSHFRNVLALRATDKKKRFRIEIETRGDPQLELWAAERATSLFEEVYQKKVVFKVNPNLQVEAAGTLPE